MFLTRSDRELTSSLLKILSLRYLEDAMRASLEGDAEAQALAKRMFSTTSSLEARISARPLTEAEEDARERFMREEAVS